MTGNERDDGKEQTASDDSTAGRPKLAEQRDINEVYQPAEDSKLLADAVVEQVETGLVVDVGTGSGYVARRLQAETDASVVGTDINPAACEQAADEGVPVVCGNLLDPVQAGSADVVCCNPPYLPTPPEQEWDDRMERALSGGEDGRAVIEPLLDDLDRALASTGVAYLLLSSLTGPDTVRERAAAAGFETATVAEQSHPFETLYVFELTPRR